MITRRPDTASILAPVAKRIPDQIKATIDPLSIAFDEDFSWTRSNACWALGYVKAEKTLERLQELRQADPEKEVRDAAEFAVHEITGSK